MGIFRDALQIYGVTLAAGLGVVAGFVPASAPIAVIASIIAVVSVGGPGVASIVARYIGRHRR